MVLLGFAVGILVGLTGTGGGSVMTPLLVVVSGINPGDSDRDPTSVSRKKLWVRSSTRSPEENT